MSFVFLCAVIVLGLGAVIALLGWMCTLMRLLRDHHARIAQLEALRQLLGR